MKLAIGTAIIGTTVLAGILLAPSIGSETSIEDIRMSENQKMSSFTPGTYVQYAFVGNGETCTGETWNVPYEYNSINEYRAAYEDAAPWRIDTTVSPSACDDNANVAAGDLPLTPPSYSYQYGIRPSDHLNKLPA